MIDQNITSFANYSSVVKGNIQIMASTYLMFKIGKYLVSYILSHKVY